MKLKVNFYTVLSSLHNCGDSVEVCKTIEEINSFKAKQITITFKYRKDWPEVKEIMALLTDGKIDDAWEKFCREYAEPCGDYYDVNEHTIELDVPELTALLGITAEEPQKWVEKCKELVAGLTGDIPESYTDQMSTIDYAVCTANKIKAMERK